LLHRPMSAPQDQKPAGQDEFYASLGEGGE
jgi:hypothetical protein